MKKKHILFALLGLVVTACSNQEIEEVSVDAGQVQVTAGIAKSRVSFNETDNMVYAYWQNGDAITLSTPTQGNLNYTATVSEGDPTTATFTPESGSLKDIDGETVYACYPASTITDGVAALPATNVWTDKQTLPFAFAVSSITDSKVNLSFDHTFAFLKLTLSAKVLENVTSSDGDKSVHRLSVKSASEPLGVVSGTFSFEDQSVSITEGSDEVVLTLSEVFNPSEETERSVYVPVLPQSGGVTITISLLHDHDGGEDVLLEMEKQTPADGLVKGNVYTLTLTGNSSAVIEGDSAEIHLAEAGTLSNYITNENKFTIKSLKLSGYLNGDDIRLLREMAGRDFYGNKTEGKLEILDLSKASIVEGGSPYLYVSSTLQHYTSNDVIGERMFKNTNLTEIQLPNDIMSINAEAFYSCENLKSVRMFDKVMVIKDMAFSSCSNLSSINLSLCIEDIGTQAFVNCFNLKSVDFPNGIKRLGNMVFTGCGLTSVTLPESVESLGYEVFSGCKSLKEVTLSGISYIGDSMFSNCTSLQSIDIPNSVHTLGNYAFADCTKLVNVNIPNSVTVMRYGVFMNCDALVQIKLPDDLKVINNQLFYGADNLSIVEVPDGVEEIAREAFSNCRSLTSIHIPSGLKKIGYSAFSYSSLSLMLTIPGSVKNIEGGAFAGTPLSTIHLEEGIEIIGHDAFSSTRIQSITIPESVRTIEAYAFSSCSLLKQAVVLGSSKIAPNVFYQCKNMEAVVFHSFNPSTESDASMGLAFNNPPCVLRVPIDAYDAYDAIYGNYFEIFTF